MVYIVNLTSWAKSVQMLVRLATDTRTRDSACSGFQKAALSLSCICCVSSGLTALKRSFAGDAIIKGRIYFIITEIHIISQYFLTTKVFLVYG